MQNRRVRKFIEQRFQNLWNQSKMVYRYYLHPHHPGRLDIPGIRDGFSQQASAIIDARKMIVEGAVGMVEMALNKLSENNIVELDQERKAAMVSNLLVVLCGSKDAQPIINSGSIY
jgi:hypothetical protein